MQTVSMMHIHTAVEGMAQGSVSARALMEACLNTAQANDNAKHSLLAIAEDALEQASACDADAKAGRIRGPLHGIPLVAKDNIDVQGLPTRVSELFPAPAPAQQSAPVIDALKKAGAIVFAKTNMDELAAHVSGKTCLGGPVYNPWKSSDKLSPGGSSSGTAVAVASGMCLGGLGSDTGGSIRIPSSWCGICGIRPTYGQIAMQGVFPRSKTMDIVGPMARCTRDVRLLLSVMAEKTLAQALAAPCDMPLDEMRVGVIPALLTDADAPVGAVYATVLERFKSMGVRNVPVDFPLLDDARMLECINTIRQFEFARDIAVYAENNPQYAKVHAIARTDYEKGKEISTADYASAMQYVETLVADVDAAFTTLGVHALMTPASLYTAPPSNADNAVFAAARRLANLFSLTRTPTMVFHGGVGANGLPVGMQLVGPCLSDPCLLNLAQGYEDAWGGTVSPNAK